MQMELYCKSVRKQENFSCSAIFLRSSSKPFLFALSALNGRSAERAMYGINHFINPGTDLGGNP